MSNALTSFMERPEIREDFSNFPEVQEFFKANGPTPAFLKGLHTVMSAVCGPRAVFAPDASEVIQDHLQSGDPSMIAMVHHSWFDPFNTAASVHEEPSLQAIQGNTIIPARMGDFNNPIFGPILVHAGAKPVYREKDLRRYYGSQGLSEAEVEEKMAEIRGDRRGLNRALLQSHIEMVDDGAIYASFVEGSRNTEDLDEVQPIRDGMKNLLEGIADSEKAKVICDGYDYGGGRFMKRYLTPTIYFDVMEVGSLEDFNERLAVTLQGCIDGARANRVEGTRLSPLAKATAGGVALGGLALARQLVKK